MVKNILENRYKPELTKIGETINPIFNIVHKSLFDRYLSDVVAQYWSQGGKKEYRVKPPWLDMLLIPIYTSMHLITLMCKCPDGSHTLSMV